MTEDINPLTALIKPWRGPLIAAHENGDKRATQVIDLYNMYVACPEPGAAGLCEAAFNDWRASKVVME